MKFKHNLLYSALFISPFVIAEGNTSLSEVTVSSSAQTENNEGSYQSRISNIANKGATPLIDSPQTVNVVNSQLIADRQPKSLDEALATVSGMTQANTLGGLMDAVLKRGFGANRDNSILRNGVIAGPSHNFSATTERVEVLKGPASVLYGIQDPGGVINVVTKKPQQEAKYVLGGSVGNNNAWGVNVDATGGLGNGFAYRFIYDQNDKDYWRNFGEIKRTLYAPSVSWQNDKTEVVLSYEHQEYTDPFDRGTYIIANGTGKGSIVNIPKEQRLDEPFNQVVGKIDVVSLQASHKLNDSWKLNAVYGYTKDTYNYWQARVTAINLDRDRVTRRLEGIQGSEQRNHSGSINAVGEFATGSIAHRVVVGVDLARTTLDIARYQGNTSNISLSNPIYNTASVANMPLATNNGHQFAELNTAGIYLQDSAYLTDKLILSGGIRYEYYDQEAGRGGSTVADRLYTDGHGGKFLYQGGLVYKFTPDWAVYGNYAQSFRPHLSRAAITESSLKPEQGESFEVGTKYENAFFSTNLALFNIDKKNVADTYTGSDGYSYQYLVGKVNSRGLEWDLHGRLTEKLGVTATYAYTDTKTRENSKYSYFNGKEFEGVPQHQASLFLTYDLGHFSFGNIRVGAGARYLGSWAVYNTYDEANIEAYKLPHSVVADAFIAYETQLGGKKVSLQL
ncbi:TonB-dependent siderophore receptor, partial [Glaesserella sp.]